MRIATVLALVTTLALVATSGHALSIVPVYAAIGDYVWEDLNGNGIQDDGNTGISGVQVELYEADGSLAGTTYTDSAGHYHFGDLVPRDYYLKFYAPSGYVVTPQNEGGDDAKDSDADRITGTTVVTSLIAGEYDNTWDAGLYLVPSPPGTGTPGYWKNHPDAWPVDFITIGGVTYSKAEAIAWMQKGDGDKTLTMFRSLVCAKLNVFMGNEYSCVADTIVAADQWMATYGPVGSGVKAKSEAWKMGEPLYLTLDAYNNGKLCAPHRD